MFTSRLVLAESSVPDFWVLAEPLMWQGETLGRYMFPSFVVPVGFLTDLASIPRALRNLAALDPDGPSRRPAVGHDWLYAWQKWGKAQSDLFLRETLQVEGCSHADAEAFYTAVRLFGDSSWADDAKPGLASHFETPAAYEAWAKV